MHDITEFLRRHDPFDALDDVALERLSAGTEVEYFARGAIILGQGADASGHVWVVRRGAVELVHDGRGLDLLGEGEMFGHPSMLSGLPTELAARAAEDVLCYRLRAADVQSLLARPAGLRFVARSLHRRGGLIAGSADVGPGFDVGAQPVGRLVRERPVVCSPETSIRDTARRMADEKTSCALVRLAEGFGIVTDRDLREKVVAGGVSVDAPTELAMTAPVFSAAPDRPATEVMLAMLDRGIRHVPVIGRDGEVLGVVSELDLLAAQARSPFALRRAIASAGDMEEVGRLARRLPATVVSLCDAGFAHEQISAMLCIVADALTRRILELLLAERGRPGLPVTWLALGSYGRREAVPGSDLDSAVVWGDVDGDDERLLRDVAAQVVETLASSGMTADAHGATARNSIFARSLTDWRTALRSWVDDPARDKVPILVSALLDSRAVTGPPAWELDVVAELRRSRRRQELQRWMLRLALVHRPPTGFRRNIVVEHSGDRRGRFDVKRGGLLPIVDIARFAGLVADAPVTGTIARLRAAADAGSLPDSDARVLSEAHELFSGLRLEHHIDRLRAGEAPDDFIDPVHLNPLLRRYVRDAFRAVAKVQRGLSSELALHGR